MIIRIFGFFTQRQCSTQQRANAPTRQRALLSGGANEPRTGSCSSMNSLARHKSNASWPTRHAPSHGVKKPLVKTHPDEARGFSLNTVNKLGGLTHWSKDLKETAWMWLYMFSTFGPHPQQTRCEKRSKLGRENPIVAATMYCPQWQPMHQKGTWLQFFFLFFSFFFFSTSLELLRTVWMTPIGSSQTHPGFQSGGLISVPASQGDIPVWDRVKHISVPASSCDAILSARTLSVTISLSSDFRAFLDFLFLQFRQQFWNLCRT